MAKAKKNTNNSKSLENINRRTDVLESLLSQAIESNKPIEKEVALTISSNIDKSSIKKTEQVLDDINEKKEEIEEPIEIKILDKSKTDIEKTVNNLNKNLKNVGKIKQNTNVLDYYTNLTIAISKFNEAIETANKSNGGVWNKNAKFDSDGKVTSGVKGAQDVKAWGDVILALQSKTKNVTDRSEINNLLNDLVSNGSISKASKDFYDALSNVSNSTVEKFKLFFDDITDIIASEATDILSKLELGKATELKSSLIKEPKTTRKRTSVKDLGVEITDEMIGETNAIDSRIDSIVKNISKKFINFNKTYDKLEKNVEDKTTKLINLDEEIDSLSKSGYDKKFRNLENDNKLKKKRNELSGEIYSLQEELDGLYDNFLQENISVMYPYLKELEKLLTLTGRDIPSNLMSILSNNGYDSLDDFFEDLESIADDKQRISLLSEDGERGYQARLKGARAEIAASIKENGKWIKSEKQVNDALNEQNHVADVNEKITQTAVEATQAEEKLAEAERQVDETKLSSDTENQIQQNEKLEKSIYEVYRAYNKMNGIKGERGISWFSSDFETMMTYLKEHPDREVVKGSLDFSKLLNIDAQGSLHNAVTYLGDGSDAASIEITNLYNRIQDLKDILSQTPNNTLQQELHELELEYDKLSEDTSNLYGTHTTNWFAIQAQEAGYLGIAIKNVIDDYNGIIDKPSTTIALFDIEQLENQKRITDEVRGSVEEVQKVIFDTKKAIGEDVINFIDSKDISDLEDELREVEEFNSLMKLTEMTAEELGSSLREVFAYAHENPDVLSNLYDYDSRLVDVFDESTNIGKYFKSMIDSTNFGVDENQLEGIYTDIASKLQQYEQEYINQVISKLHSAISTNKNGLSSGTTSPAVEQQNELQDELKETQAQAKETKTAIEDVIYHSGTISKLNKAETNGQFYGSNRGTGFFGTGHYFVDNNTKHEIMSGQFASKPFTSVDISQYDNLFKANTDELAGKLHSFLANLTKYTQGSDSYNLSELFSQFEDVFGKNILSEEEFNNRLSNLLNYMSKSSMGDRGDSVSTQFMKSLGYGGVDTRGTNYADTRYGTVIYDLKEESILQANITDELQKQGDMLDKISYKSGEVFDKLEDERIQGILDKQSQNKAISDEYNRIFDSTALNQADSELETAENRLREINNIIGECQYQIDNAEQEVKSFNKEMAAIGLFLPEEELQSQIEEHKKSYQEKIDELSVEKKELESQIPILQEKYDLESKLSQEAYEQAKNTVLGKSNKSDISTEVKSEEKLQDTVIETTEAFTEQAKQLNKLGKNAAIKLLQDELELTQDAAKTLFEDNFNKATVISLSRINDLIDAQKKLKEAIESTPSSTPIPPTPPSNGGGGKPPKNNGGGGNPPNNIPPIIPPDDDTLEKFHKAMDEVAKLKGDVANIRVFSDGDDNLIQGTLTYIDRNLKRIYQETYEWHTADEEIEGDYDRLILKSKSFTDNQLDYQEALQKSQEKLNKLRADYIEKLSKVDNYYKSTQEFKDLESAIKNMNSISDKTGIDTLFARLNAKIAEFKQNVKSTASLDPVKAATNTVEKIDSKIQLMWQDFQKLGLSADEATDKIKEMQRVGDLIKMANSAGDIERVGKLLKDYNKIVRDLNDEKKIISNQNQIERKTNKEATESNQRLATSYRELKKYLKEYYDLLAKETTGDITEAEQGRLDYIRKLKDELAAIDIDSRGTIGSQNAIKKLREEIDNIFSGNNNSFAEYISNAEKQLLSFKDVLDSNQYSSDYNNSFIQVIMSQSEKIDSLLSKLKLDYSQLDSVTLDNLISEIASVTKESQELIKTANNVSSRLKLEKLAGRIAKTLKDNSAMSKELKIEFNALKKEIEADIQSPVKVTDDEVKALNLRFQRLNTIMEDSGQTGKNAFDRIVSSIKTTNAQLIARYLSLQDMIRYARNAYESVRELDTALVDLRKTTSMSTIELNKFYYASNDIAKDMGVTTAEIINQASAFSRLGYSSYEASTQMAELSSKFASISPDMDVSTATDGLVSIMKAFDVEVEDVERKILDNINRIGNTAATSNGEIVDMLKRSSAAMKEANNSLEETIALETAAVEITRSAETTGTAFKTVAMRIRGYDEETEELSEDLENIAGDIADLTKTAKTPGGISLFSDKDKTTYKSTYQLLKEISEIYDDLTDKQQAELLEKLAGKRGGQVVGSLINNFDAVDKALENMEGAAGSADAEMEVIRDSIDYKLNELKQTWVGTWQDILKRDDLGNIIETLTIFSEAINKVVNSVGLLGTAGIAGAGVAAFKNVGKAKMLAFINMPTRI